MAVFLVQIEETTMTMIVSVAPKRDRLHMTS